MDDYRDRTCSTEQNCLKKILTFSLPGMYSYTAGTYSHKNGYYNHILTEEKTMKNTTLALVLSLACALALLPSCNEEDTATELRWNNQQEDTLTEIKWVSNDDADDVDQTWTGTYDDGAVTEFKEVDLLNGQGIGSDGGTSFRIISDSDYNFILNEGDSETLTIDGLDNI